MALPTFPREDHVDFAIEVIRGITDALQQIDFSDPRLSGIRVTVKLRQKRLMVAGKQYPIPRSVIVEPELRFE